MMILKKSILFAWLGLSLVAVSSCNDFLNKAPDSRVEIDTPEKITKLLVSGYMDYNYAKIAELSADNFVDNDSPDPDANGYYYNLSSSQEMDDELFAWKDVMSSSDVDSPSAVWISCYNSIAVANQALETIRKYEDEGRGAEVSAQKGEALLIRAYHHFILANLFCQTYKNEASSKTDSGVPYVTEPENQVLVKYNRSNVADTYRKIESDMLAGIGLLNDGSYDIPKYHFNKQAAYAFATRFYLFKRDYEKVVEYADKVLGNNPSIYMRNWAADYPTFSSFAYGWVDATSLNNFLLLPTYSTFNRIFGTRYGCNRRAAKATIYGTGPTWSGYNFAPCYSGRLYIRDSQSYGLFFPKIGEFFEYTDKVAGIGFAHIVRAELTGEETLLNRAEAYVYLNQIDNAVADLKVFDNSRRMPGYTYKDLTLGLINSFYSVSSNPLFVNTFNTQSISPDFVVRADQKAVLDCVLHFRRLETIFDGMRWFDIKRYGIEVTHNIGKGADVLTVDDPRRAIQIPFDVIAAGMSPNQRVQVKVGIAPTMSGLVLMK